MTTRRPDRGYDQDGAHLAREFKAPLEITDNSTPGVTYHGQAEDQTATFPDAKWRIRQVISIDDKVVLERYAGTSGDAIGNFDQVWDDRASLFPSTPVVFTPLPTTTEALLTQIRDYVDQLEGYTDMLESLATTGNTSLAAIATATQTLETYTDNIEPLLSGVQTTLTAISGFVDGLEGFTDGIEGALTSLISGVATLIGQVGSLDTKFDVALSTRASEITLSGFKVAFDSFALIASTGARQDALKTAFDAFALVASTSALQTAGNASLTSLVAKDFSTAAKQDLAKAVLDTIFSAQATAVKQDALKAAFDAYALVASTSAKQDTGNASLASLVAKDFATSAKQDTAFTEAQLFHSDNNARIGSLTETAPATDTASSGLNGRLQRIAQRVTSLIAVAATEVTLAAQNVLIGAVTETATTTDTASSGLNGRLQRIAQRLTSLIAFFSSDYGASTSAIRVAAQVGSATGAADFNAGATGAQTLRTAAQLHDSTGNGITSRTYDTKRPAEVYLPQLGASTATSTRTTPTANVSTTIAAANPARKWLRIDNGSGAEFFMKFGAAAVVNQGISIPNNTAYVMTATELYLGAVNVIVASNSRTIEVTEGT